MSNLGVLPGTASGRDKTLRRRVEEYVLIQNIKANPSGQQNKAITASTWTTCDLNTIVEDEVGGVKIDTATGRVTIPSGKYRVEAVGYGFQTSATNFRLRDVVNNLTLAMSMNMHISTVRLIEMPVMMLDVFTVYRPTTFEMQAISQSTNSNGYGLGHHTVVGMDTQFETVELTRVLA